MKVIKRNGTMEDVQFDKITRRINKLIYPYEKKYKILDATQITLKLLKSNYVIDRCKTSDIDEYAAEICAHMSTIEPKYNELAGRICISNLHKLSGKDKKLGLQKTKFSDIVTKCYYNINEFKKKQPLVSEKFYKFVMKYKQYLDECVDYDRDYKIDYFGFKTLEKNYLLKKDPKNIIESPQDMFMRVAIALNMNDVMNKISDLDIIKISYEAFSLKQYTRYTDFI